MHIEQLASGRYRATVKVGGRGGKRTRKTFDHEYEAEGWALDVEAAYARGKGVAALDLEAPATPAGPALGAAPAAPEAPTLYEHGMVWVAQGGGRGGITKGTADGYRRHLRALKADGIGDLPLTAITRGTVKAWRTAALEAWPEGHHKGGRSTLNARLKVIRMVYLDAMAEGVVPVGFNPTTKVDDLTLSQRGKRILTLEERAELLEAAPAHYRLPILLGLDCGLRWEEVYGLPASAVSAEFVDVWQVIEGRGAARALREYPKGHRNRPVPIGTEELSAELTAWAAERIAADGPDAVMFTSRAGTLVDYNNHRRAWDALMGATSIPRPPGFHGLRHTYGSELAAAGVPRSEIAVLMGHADEATTAVYIHAGHDGARLERVRAVFAKRAPARPGNTPEPAKVRHLRAVV